jgi:alpha-galactosidase
VGLLNRSTAAATMSVTFSQIGLGAGSATVRDVWARADRGSFATSYSVSVPSHGIALLRIVGQDPIVASGFVSDQTWTYQANGFGPAERDKSNNGSAGGDGHTLTLNGVTYPKGIGAHAPSSIELRPNGHCTHFSASIGVDDEVGTNGNVDFRVVADGNVIFDSGIMTGATATQNVDVDLTGHNDLRLMVTGGTDTKNSDHADWANAQLTCSAPQAIEAESSGNTLSGSAAVGACSTCSGGFKVRFLGNGPSNYVVINNVNELSAGTYQLTIQYLLSGTRTFFVGINGAPGAPVNLTGTSWSVPATATIPVVLVPGANALRFYNDTAFAPDLDKITVQ